MIDGLVYPQGANQHVFMNDIYICTAVIVISTGWLLCSLQSTTLSIISDELFELDVFSFKAGLTERNFKTKPRLTTVSCWHYVYAVLIYVK